MTANLQHLPRSKGAAAALDFFIWGSGHGYLGYRKALGLPWIIWTFILVLLSIIEAYVATQTTAYYYFDTSTGFPQLAYNSGEAAAVTFVPYLVIGGLLIVDLVRNRATAATGAFMALSPGTTACPSCGNVVAPADIFCPACGGNLRASAQAAPAQAEARGNTLCNSCGTTNPANYAFCKRCGNRLV